ncbi:hypothetical protein AAG906_003496 [Vitis piasezkii]
MPAKNDIASSNATRQGEKSGRTGEFRKCFFIPNGVSVQLVDGDPTSIEKVTHGKFLHYTQIPTAYIYPNIVRVLMGCNILNMLFHLDLSLLEVFFVYTIKRGKKDIFSMFAHIPFLQSMTGLPIRTKGEPKDMYWFGDHRLKGSSGGVGGKSVIHLFEQAIRNYYKRNEPSNPQPYVLPIIPRRLPMVVVPGEHFILKNLPFYEEECEANAKARQEHLDQREEKRQEGKLRRASDENGRASLSNFAKAIKASTSVFALSSASTPSASTSADSFV